MLPSQFTSSSRRTLLTHAIRGAALVLIIGLVIGTASGPGAQSGPARGLGASTSALALPDRLAVASPERRGIAVVGEASAPCPEPCHPLRSLVATDVEILKRFKFEDVMERLACPPDAGCDPKEARGRALALFRQWWDTQNADGPGPGPKCRPELFGFPYQCPRKEGEQASYPDPFSDEPAGSRYIAIGLFNRIDLADREGRDCGEYRVVFARSSGMTDDNSRLLINFEGVLPNPEPARALAGCKPIAEFWYRLSHAEYDDEARRADALHGFYFRGLPGFLPVIHADSFGGRRCLPNVRHCATGQIRTNQFMQPPWVLREFRLVRDAATHAARVLPTTVNDNPYGDLFTKKPIPWSPEFREAFLASVSTLARKNLANLCYGNADDCGHSPASFNAAESNTRKNDVNDYPERLKRDPDFAARIERRLAGTPVTSAEHLVNRALVLSCAGCHELSYTDRKRDLGGGVVWPDKKPRDKSSTTSRFDFVHVSEQIQVGTGRPNSTRYATSGVVDELVKHRREKLGYVLSLP